MQDAPADVDAKETHNVYHENQNHWIEKDMRVLDKRKSYSLDPEMVSTMSRNGRGMGD